MAHNVNEIIGGEFDGKKAMFAVADASGNADVWHDPENSVALSAAPSLGRALVIGGLDFDVSLRTVRTVDGDVEIPESIARAVVRTDAQTGRETALGVVGPAYTPIQNADAFAIFEPLLDAGLVSLETGGALGNGADVWMLAKLNLSDVPGLSETLSAGGRDEVRPYVLACNNHNGKRKAIIQETPVRVVCANTLGFSLARISGGRKLDRSIALRHTKNVASRMVSAAEEMFGTMIERYESIAAQYATMRAARLSEEQFRRAVLDVLAPLPAKREGATSKGNIAAAHHERATARAEAKRSRLSFLWANGDGHAGDASAWEAYNAATQSLDHDVDLWKIKGESRIEGMFDGSLGKLKAAVTESVMIEALIAAGTR